MSRTSKLSLEDKQDIADIYTFTHSNQTEIADLYNVSRRTIQRALGEMGVKIYHNKAPRHVSEEQENILECVKKHNLDAATLNRALNTTALSKHNVQKYLVDVDPAELTNILCVVGYLRIHELAKQQAANTEDQRRQQEAANG